MRLKTQLEFEGMSRELPGRASGLVLELGMRGSLLSIARLSTRQQDEPLTVCLFCPRFVEKRRHSDNIGDQADRQSAKNRLHRCPSGPNHKTTDQAAKVAVRSDELWLAGSKSVPWCIFPEGKRPF